MTEGKAQTEQVVDSSALEPQHIGLVHEEDRERARTDKDSVIIENEDGELSIAMTPVSNNSEVNKAFFEGTSGAYYLNWLDIKSEKEHPPELIEKLKSLASGTRIMIEHRADDEKPLCLWDSLIKTAGRKSVPDSRSIDEEDGEVAGVYHYFSPVRRESDPGIAFGSLREAYRHLVDAGQWEKFEGKGVKFATGEDIDAELAEKLWEVYDKTFDQLVENHPAAQKQPKGDFIAQLTLPEMAVTYAEVDGKAVSALFMLDDASVCSWLNIAYFDQLNPHGRTAFVPGVSTKLDQRGMAFSPRTIAAMSAVAELVPDITGFATQCTNRSSKYIPLLTNRYTKGSCNLNLAETVRYEYPVFAII